MFIENNINQYTLIKFCRTLEVVPILRVKKTIIFIVYFIMDPESNDFLREGLSL